MDISQWADQFKAHIDEGGTYTQEVVLEIINELQAQNERYRAALEKIAEDDGWYEDEETGNWKLSEAPYELFKKLAQQALKETK